MRYVRIRFGDLHAIDVARFHCRSFGGQDFRHGTEQSRQALEVVYADLRERSYLAFVVPARPGGARVAIQAARRMRPADGSGAEMPPEHAKRRSQLHEWRSHQHQPFCRRQPDQFLGAFSRRRERLFHEHVLPVLQRKLCQLGVTVGRCDDDYCIGIGLDNVARLRRQENARTPRTQLGPRLAPPRTDRTFHRVTSRREPVQYLQVCGQNVTRADNPDFYRRSPRFHRGDPRERRSRQSRRRA